MEKEIYNANPLETLKNECFRLQRLQEEGHNVTPLLEETWDRIKEIIEQDDRVKISTLRERISDIIKEENDTRKQS